MRFDKRSSAFTLIEIIIAITLIAIFVTIPVLAYSNYSKNTRDTQRKNDVNKVQAALELYKANNGKYPAQETWMEDLVNGGYIPSIPTDPRDGQESGGTNGIAYGYEYNVSEDGQTYEVKAVLENKGEDGETKEYVGTPEGTKEDVINDDPQAPIDPDGPEGPLPPATATPFGFIASPTSRVTSRTPTPTYTPTNTPIPPTPTATPVRPDLIVSNITRDATNYTITYCNNGLGSSASTMTIELRRLVSPNGTGAGWDRTGGKAVPAPGQCATHTVARCFSTESGGGCSDSITVRATVNFYNFEVEEYDYINNSRDQAFTASATNTPVPSTAIPPTATPVCQNYMACSTNAQCGSGTCYSGGFCTCPYFTVPSPAKILFTSNHTAPAYPTNGYDKDCDYETYEMNQNGTGVVQVTNACTNNLSNAIQASYSADRNCIIYTGVVQSTYGPSVETTYVTNAPGKSCSVASGAKISGSYYCGGYDGYCYVDNTRDPIFSTDKSRIYVSQRRVTDFSGGYPTYSNYNIVAAFSNGGIIGTLTSSGDNLSPAASPDGTKIVYTSTSSGNSEIWIMNTDGTGKTQLTDSSGTAQFYQKGNFQPSITANGSKIVFLSNREKTSSPDFSDVYIMNIDGSAETMVANYNRYKVGVSVNAHGPQIAIFEQSKVYTIYPDGTGLTELFPGRNANSWSAYGNAHGLGSYK